MTITKNLFKTLLPQIIVFGILFYAVPLLTFLSGNLDSSYFSNTLLILNPTVCLVMNIAHSLRYKFIWYAPLLAGVMFTPTVFIFYNVTAVPYIFSYIVLSYIGTAVGISINKSKDTNDD